jgi:Tol biopolymer transport system component
MAEDGARVVSQSRRCSRSAYRLIIPATRMTLRRLYLPALAAVVALAAAPVDAPATFPGSNGQIAYDRTDNSADPPLPYDILTVGPNGGRVRNITADASYDEDPAWSPDGSKIAYASGNFLGDIYRIWLTTARGAGKTQLTHLPGISLSPSWSPDGSRIVFLYDDNLDGSAEVFTMSADGSDIRAVTATGTDHVAPKWSPDGRRILFSAQASTDRSSDYDLYTIRPDGTDLRRVASIPSGDQVDPDWSPDGTQIVFATAYPKETPFRLVLGRIRADGTGLVSLDASGDDPVWSPDGTKIAYRDWSDPGSTLDLAVIDADGTNRRSLDSNPISNEGSPSWQRLATAKRDCLAGGWMNYGDRFRNQGQCVAFVQHGP